MLSKSLWLAVAESWSILSYYFPLCLEIIYQHNNFQTRKLYHFNLNPRNKGAICPALCLSNSCFLQTTWQYHSRHFWLRQGVYLQYLRKYFFLWRKCHSLYFILKVISQWEKMSLLLFSLLKKIKQFLLFFSPL